MDIKNLPSTTKCLVDANIIIYHLNKLSTDCRIFFERVARREITAYVTTTIVAETLHRNMLSEAVTKGLAPATRTLNYLKTNPAIITHLTDYITSAERMLLLPLKILESNVSDISAGHALRSMHGLFTNDSINLACAQRFGIVDIVSHDSDFARVPSINLWSPTDI